MIIVDGGFVALTVIIFLFLFISGSLVSAMIAMGEGFFAFLIGWVLSGLASLAAFFLLIRHGL